MECEKINAYFITALSETSPQALPLGAACIASSVKHNSLTKDFFSSSLYAFSLETCTDAKVISEKIIEVFPNIKEEKCPVCMSVYVWNRNILTDLVTILQKINNRLIFICGGPEATANPFSMKNFDYAIVGQGEESLPLLLHSLFIKKTDSFSIPGIYCPKKEIADTKVVRSCQPKVDTLFSPYLDGTLDPTSYGGALWELARGCPFKCSYCYESKGEKTISYFPKERLDAEIDFFAKKDVPQIFVLDPTYNANKKKALEILKVISKKLPRTFFYFEARAEFIDREMANAFAKIKCAVQFGLQSADENVLKNVNRSFNRKVFKHNVGFLNDAGVVFGFDLIYGLPGDTFTGFKKSIDFALSLYPNNLELFCLSVLPGTKLYDDAKSFHLIWNKEPPYNVIESPTFPEKDLQKASKLSFTTDLFYNAGRAVPWFMIIVTALKESPSFFLSDFTHYLQEKNYLQKSVKGEEIQKLQKDFVSKKFSEKRLSKLLPAALDLIELNGALGLCSAEGKESVISLSYHPDDLMSGYACDLHFFSANAGKQKNKTRVFVGNDGPDWALVK